MQDERGLYYYPVLNNRNLKMYVKLLEDDIAFRLWDDDNHAMWDEHGWVPWTALNQAAAIYMETKDGHAPPMHLYDMEIAIRILKDAVRDLPEGEQQ